MIRIPRQVASKIGYYVYVYTDPRTGKPFYIGKGKRSRVLTHLQADGRSRKARKLRSLRRAGLQPRIEILAHGIPDQETALRIEAAAIDLLGLDRLTNLVRGWKSVELGRIPLRSLIAYYHPRPVHITHGVLLIRINRLFSHGMSAQALYEATRGCWRLDRARAADARFAFAVFQGIVQEVYEICRWYQAGSTKYYTHVQEDVNRPERSEFTGRKAPENIRRRYVGRSVERYLRKGLQSPVLYVNC